MVRRLAQEVFQLFFVDSVVVEHIDMNLVDQILSFGNVLGRAAGNKEQ